jgi:hypothetical protein
MENGELIVTIPKKEVKKNETKVIQIKGNWRICGFFFFYDMLKFKIM